MGTAFSVMYAIIYMIYIETPVIRQFQAFITLYKRYIDDCIVIWTGPEADFDLFKAAFAARHPRIKLEWADTVGASSLAHSNRAVFMDCDIQRVHHGTSVEFSFSVYHKPLNSYQYLPYGSFHPKHMFAGFVKAELLRYLSHSSSFEVFQREYLLFYKHLRSRGYRDRTLQALFHQVDWKDRQYVARPPESSADGKFNHLKGCVWTLTHRPGTDQVSQLLSPLLDIQRQLDAPHHAAFAPRALVARKAGPTLGSLIGR